MRIPREVSVRRYGWTAFICVSMLIGLSPPGWAQSRLSLQQAVDKALESRALLRAEAERISAEQGRRQQAGLLPNPEFQFSNENLRPGQNYSRDVDTLAYFTQPLDVLGKRKQRIATAEQTVRRTEAEYALVRRQVVQSVQLAYWVARGAQERRDLLKATAANFQSIIDYHAARLSVGAISEQDFLRVRLEGERIKIAANLAMIETTRTLVRLLKQMGETDVSEVVLTEPLEAGAVAIAPVELQQVLAQRLEMRVAAAAVEEAESRARLEDVSARPDLNLIYGYKRTQVGNSGSGANTAIGGLQINFPIFNRNQGNRAAAGAELRRQRQLLAATEADVRADYFGALQEYQLRRDEVVDTLQPLREQAATIAEIAQAAYAQGGTDLLRLLDAERARLDAELAYVQEMVDYRQSIVNLQAAEGVAP